MKTLKTILFIFVPFLSYGQLTLTLADNKISKYQKWAGTGNDLKYVSYSGFFLSGVAGGMEFKNNERGIYQTKWEQIQKVSLGLSSVAGGCSIYFTRKEKHKVGKALLQIAYSTTFFCLGKQTGKLLNK